MTDFRFEPLDRRHDRQGFRCASPALNAYLQQQARKDGERHVAATFVMIDASAPTVIVGYYTLSSFAVKLDDLPEAVTKKLPRYPRMPATLIGRLARDERYPGTGSLLLMDALARSYAQSTQIASLAVVAEAKDNAAEGFYRKFGFGSLGGETRRLFLPMGTIAKLAGG